MSGQDAIPKEDPLKEQADLLRDVHGRSVDWYLQRMVNLANDAGIEIGVTLAVEGQVISGYLIGGRKFFDQTAASLAKALVNPSESEEELHAALLMGTESFYGTTSAETGHTKPPPTFLHLRDAQIFGPGQPPLPENGGNLWRGRINSVSGWSLGVLKRASAPA